MNDMVIVREADANDATLIADMSRRTFYESFSADNTAENMTLFLDTQFTKEALVAEVGQPGNVFLLATLDDQPAGYARLAENTPPPELGPGSAIEIVRIYAEQWAIGKGVGNALMKYALDLSRQKGLEYIWLGVWEHNHRAKAFYTKWGFEKFGEHIFVVGTDPQTDWWMRRSLPGQP